MTDREATRERRVGVAELIRPLARFNRQTRRVIRFTRAQDDDGRAVRDHFGSDSEFDLPTWLACGYVFKDGVDVDEARPTGASGRWWHSCP